MTRLLAAVAAAVLLAGGCSTVQVRGEQLDADLVEAAGLALLHQLAHELVARPGVVCAEALVSDDGVPTRPATDQSLTVVTAGLTVAQRDALAREAGRRMWTSSAPLVTGVDVLVLDDGGAEGTGSDLGALLTGSRGGVSPVVLAEEFGDRPTPPPLTTAPPDPGDPGCP